MSSESKVLVMRVEHVEHHENADALDLIRVSGGYPVITRRDEFRLGDRVAYVPVDLMLPVSDPRFAFLAARSVNAEGYHRVRAVRLRGTFSMGIVFPAPESPEGTDLTSDFGAVKYEPPLPAGTASDDEPCPFDFPTYTDIESFRRLRDAFRTDEEVVVTEKIHGANMRAVWHDGRLWVGSRSNAKKQSPGDPWWRAARAARLEQLRSFPDIVVFGECYGPVQDLRYGLREPAFVMFDALDLQTRRWLPLEATDRLAADLNVPRVPVLYQGPLPATEGELWALAEGKTALGAGAHVREGAVIRPTEERYDLRFGRVIAKLVGEGYHLRKGG